MVISMLIFVMADKFLHNIIKGFAKKLYFLVNLITT